MALDDKDLWNYLLKQDENLIAEFELGIVGIGAFFIAFSTVKSIELQEIVAFIAFAGSFIILMHMFAARRDYKEYRKILISFEQTNADNMASHENQTFFKRINESREWRYTGINRFIYFPFHRLMLYFMVLVSVIWLFIFLELVGFTRQVLITILIIFIVSVIVLTIFKKNSTSSG
jgi:hypothetical protein